MSYDDWRTRTDIDDRHHGEKMPRSFPQRKSSWRTCPDHGWTEHQAFPGDVPMCVQCYDEAQRKRFDQIMSFVLGPRPE